MKRIKLRQHLSIAGPTVYIVTKLVNDISFSIGSPLSTAQVRDLCDNVDWHVDIVGHAS